MKSIEFSIPDIWPKGNPRVFKFQTECFILPEGQKKPLPGDEEWTILKMKLNEAELLPATEDQRESTKAEKGGGGGLWNCIEF